MPIWSTSTYAQFRVMKLVKESGVKVVLDGQGGDELFAGYDPYYTFHLTDLAKGMRFNTMMNELRDATGTSRSMRSIAKDFLKYKVLAHLPSNLRTGIYKQVFPELAYVKPDIINLAARSRSGADVPVPSTLNEMLHKEFVNTRLKLYLKCEDRCAMHFGIESRTPFSDDHLLIEHVFSIPGVYKIRNGVSKYLLREAASPFLPEAIKNRTDKMGYVTPHNRWMSAIYPLAMDYFTPDLSEFVDVYKIRKEAKKLFDAPEKAENGRVFRFISFAIWKKKFSG